MDLTRYDADLLLRLVRKAVPKARKTVQGKVAVPVRLSGRDADVVRLENLERMERRLAAEVRELARAEERRPEGGD